jgi:glycine/D-amino acid oxidase-like deaminating enzyme
MKILIANRLNSRLSASRLGNQIVYCPELATQPEDVLRSALVRHLPDAVLIDNRSISTETLTTWKKATNRAIHLIQIHHDLSLPPIHHLPDVSIDRVQGNSADYQSNLAALGLAERSFISRQTAKQLAACGISATGSPSSIAGTRVTLVGAGIVNLIAAYDLVENGFTVEILEASPDPRSKPDWQQLGTTHGGGNARMFCFTEADNYNEKKNLVYADMNTVMHKQIHAGGWLVTPPAELHASERDWIDNHCALPCWQAEIFTQDIHNFNIASGKLWEQLRLNAPHLFENVGYLPDVVRIYAQPEKFEAAQKLHRQLGSLQRTFDNHALSDHHPAFAAAVANGEIAGAMEIRGFTLNIHDFVANLLSDLEARGVDFQWQRRVTAIERTSDGCVSGLHTVEGIVRSEHYVISPGAYVDSLLEGSRAHGKIQGILGLWLNLPNIEPRLENSVKIHREGHVGEDSNVTIATDSAGEPILILGSGYGFIGTQPLDLDSPEIACLFEALEQTAERYFPGAYQQAVRAGTLHSDRKACIRPFTSTGLGIFEVDSTATGGRLVIAAGHNTGGFTQAPVVAAAVTATLTGKSHLMQSLYHPERGISKYVTNSASILASALA